MNQIDKTSRFKAAIEVVGRNVAYTLILLFILNMLAAVVMAWIERPGGISGDNRWKLPNYASYRDYARLIFEEYNATTTTYQPFVGWRRGPFQGVTTHVDSLGCRLTPDPAPDQPKTHAVYFFGGSTMWGTGADDAHTIPACFARQAPWCRVVNQGEKAWNSRQELDQLITLYARGQRPDVVVFYDGVNDVYHQCTRLTDVVPGHARVEYLRQATKMGSRMGVMRTFKALFLENLMALAAEIRKLEVFRKAAGPCSTFICPCDRGRAEAIADNLIANWAIAKTLVEAHGGTFLPVLQPVIFEGNPHTSHLGDNLDRPYGIASTYKLMYALIKEKLREHPIGVDVLDLTDAFDSEKLLYIDFCHVSKEGNAIVADRIFQRLQQAITMQVGSSR